MMPIDELFQIRDTIIKMYKRYERYIAPVLRFLVIAMILITMNKSMGYLRPLDKLTVVLIFALVGALAPPNLLLLGLIVLVSLHIGAMAMTIGALVFVISMMIYFLYIRLYPIESLLIVAMLIAYKLHIPYIVPLFAGLFTQPVSVVAIIIGVGIWHAMPQLITIMQAKIPNLTTMVDTFNASIIALKEIFQSDQTMIASMVIFSVVLITIYLIRKQSIDYAEYIAILVGSIINVIGFVFAILLLNIDVGLIGLIISTLICAILAVGVQFFCKALDYSRAETVQFEDEDNYYYVKVVPKVIINPPKKQIRHIYTNEDIDSNGHED